MTKLTRVCGSVGDSWIKSMTLDEATSQRTYKIGDAYEITDRANGRYVVSSATAFPPNGYSNVAIPSTNLVLRLDYRGKTIDLEQIGGKPLIWNEQMVDCKQALQEAFYLLLNEDSATVDLKSEKWYLSSYEFNDVKQRRKIRGDNAVIYGFAATDDNVQRPYLISTAWNYQDIEGVTLDLQWNPNYACALRVTHGYGRYNKITIRKSRCMLQIGLPDQSPVSLSEFMFHELVGEQNAKIAVVHGLYTVLQISDSILPCGEGDFWKSYDCTGFTSYGARIFLNKCGGNSNLITQDNPYVFCSTTTEQGRKYVGSFSATQCDFELRTRFILVNDDSTGYQDYQQSVSLYDSRIAAWATLDSRADILFESNNGYRGVFRMKGCDVCVDRPLNREPIRIGARTIADIDFHSFYDPNYTGHELVKWSQFPPLMKKTTLYQGNLGGNFTTVAGGNFLDFGAPIAGLEGDQLVLSGLWDKTAKKFIVPPSGLSSVTATLKLQLTAPAPADISVLIEVNAGSAIGIARGVIPAGQKYISLVGTIPVLPANAQLYVITDCSAPFTLDGSGYYETNLAIEGEIKAPKSRA